MSEFPNVAPTPQQKLDELAKRLRAYPDDPVGFARDILDVDPHLGQQRWLVRTNLGLEAYNALTCGNRFGKSHVAAIRLIHRAVYRKGWTESTGIAMARKHEGYHAINISNTADQANIVHDKAMGMLQGPKAAWLVDKFTSSPFLETRLVNKSIIEARSTAHNGNHLLGHSYDFVNFDEAAFATNFSYIMDNVLKMRVADRKGIIDFTSTGNGRNAYGRFFLDGLEGRNPDLYAQVGSSYENPHIPHDRVSSNADSMSERMRMQNIEGAIVDAGGEYFDPVDLDAAHNPLFDEMAYIRMDAEEEVAFMELRPDGTPWRWKYPTHKYITGWDLADKKDYMTGFTFDISVAPAVLVEFQRFHKMGWEHNIAQMRATDDKYGIKSTKFDSTGVGDVVGDHLKDIRAEGVNFSGTRKDEVLTNLRVVLSQRAIQFPYILVMQNEIRSYDRKDDGLMTDCVMGLAVACWWVKRTRRYSFAGTV